MTTCCENLLRKYTARFLAAPSGLIWRRHPDSEEALRAWYRVARLADWATPAQVRAEFSSASILRKNRVVFRIRGNNYRLVTSISYSFGEVYIRFIGTHAEYNRINAEEVCRGGIGMEWNNPIQNDEEHLAALAMLWEVFHAEPGTPEGDESDVLADLIEAYEEIHFPIDPPTDPVAVIEFWMDQKSLTQADLAPCIGSRDAVAEVLSYQRPVTPQMAQALERLFRLEPGHIPLKPVVSNPIPPVNHV